MPPKTKRTEKRYCELTSSLKEFRIVQPIEKPRKESQTMIALLNTSLEAANTEDEDVDPSFELNSSIKSDAAFRMETFNEEWAN